MKRKNTAPRMKSAMDRIFEAFDKNYPNVARTARARVNMSGIDFPRSAFASGSPRGFTLMAEFIGEHHRQYRDSPVAKEIARRFVAIIQGANPSTALELRKPNKRPKGSFVVDQRIIDAMGECMTRAFLDREGFPTYHKAMAGAISAVSKRLDMDPKKVRRHWAKSSEFYKEPKSRKLAVRKDKKVAQ